GGGGAGILARRQQRGAPNFQYPEPLPRAVSCILHPVTRAGMARPVARPFPRFQLFTFNFQLADSRHAALACSPPLSVRAGGAAALAAALAFAVAAVAAGVASATGRLSAAAATAATTTTTAATAAAATTAAAVTASAV